VIGLVTGANGHPPTRGSSLDRVQADSQIQQENNECAVKKDKSLAGAESDSSMFLSKRQRRLLEVSKKYKMELEKARIEADERLFRQFLERDKREQERAEKNQMEEEREFAEAQASPITPQHKLHRSNKISLLKNVFFLFIFQKTSFALEGKCRK
jgi:hypothetical protein